MHSLLSILHYILSAVQGRIISGKDSELSFNGEKDFLLSKPAPFPDYNTHQIGAVFSNFNRTPNTTRIFK